MTQCMIYVFNNLQPSTLRPTEGGRLSPPMHCSKGAQPVPKAVYHSSCCDEQNRLRCDSNLGPLTVRRGYRDLHVYSSQCYCYVSCGLRAAAYRLIKKSKGSPYSITERRVPELIPVLGSQPAGDVSHKPGGRLPLLSARPAVTLATLARGLLPILLLGEQRHDGCEQFA